MDVIVGVDGRISSLTIKAGLKLHLSVCMNRTVEICISMCVCVYVRRLASAGLLTRGYHTLKGLKCQDFTVSRTMLSTLILASAKEIEWLTAAVVSLRPEWCIFLLSCSRSIGESMFLAGIYILYGIFIFYRKKSGKWQVLPTLALIVTAVG